MVILLIKGSTSTAYMLASAARLISGALGDCEHDEHTKHMPTRLLVQDGSVIGFDSSGGSSLRLHPATNVQLSPEDIAVWQSSLLLFPGTICTA